MRTLGVMITFIGILMAGDRYLYFKGYFVILFGLSIFVLGWWRWLSRRPRD
jgi:hypothetical protein